LHDGCTVFVDSNVTKVVDEFFDDDFCLHLHMR
jgi:hypothetical protein